MNWLVPPGKAQNAEGKHKPWSAFLHALQCQPQRYLSSQFIDVSWLELHLSSTVQTKERELILCLMNVSCAGKAIC